MRTTMSVLALCGIISLAGAASAQSVGAPAGRDPATAPGGTEGSAGMRNEEGAVRRGDIVPAPPGIGEPVPQATDTAPDRSPPPRP